MPTRYLRYRSSLRSRAQSLRGNPTSAERKLWFHYTDEGAGYDRVRTQELERLRLRVIRFTNEDVVERFEAVCEGIRRALEIGREP